MFSIIGMINSWIGYINMNAKVKNRVYTVLGGIGNFYLLYVAYRFYVNGFPLRGTLFILAFLVLLYFTYLNIVYFFTNKKAKFDISPAIMKALHITPRDPEEEAKKKVERARRYYERSGYVQTNGIFSEGNLLPATLKFTATERSNIQRLARKLAQMGYLKLDYGGLSEREIFQQVNATAGGQVHAMAEPVALPYFSLEQRAGRLLVYGGVNQMERHHLATITSVGLMPSNQAQRKYELSIATAFLINGPYKTSGRSVPVEENAPFSLKVQLAYKHKSQPAAEETSYTSSQASSSQGYSDSFMNSSEENSQSQSSQPLRRNQHRDWGETDSDDFKSYGADSQNNSSSAGSDDTPHYSRTERYHRR